MSTEQTAEREKQFDELKVEKFTGWTPLAGKPGFEVRKVGLRYYIRRMEKERTI